MPVINDPWNQDFADFKTAYEGSETLRGFCIVTRGDLEALLALQNADLQKATHVVFYTVDAPPDTGGGRRTVGVPVAVAANGIPTRVVDHNSRLRYAVPIHNCPPECKGTTPPVILDRVNLNLSGSMG